MDPPRGPILFPANEKNLAAARRWLSYVDAGGLTDIMTPVLHSLKLFDAAHLSTRAQLPIVFLITDGAVENEREICAVVEKAAKEQNARFFAFGIGTACNAYFLRMMASIGRGYSDVCLTLPPKPDVESGMLKAAPVETVRGGVKSQMAALLAHARTPLLTDVSIEPEKIGALGGLELWPKTTPDLYGGAPVLVCGKQVGRASPPPPWWPLSPTSLPAAPGRSQRAPPHAPPPHAVASYRIVQVHFRHPHLAHREGQLARVARIHPAHWLR